MRLHRQQAQLDGGATRFSPAGRVRAMARLQRWQDESALLPVTRVGSQNLVGRLHPAANQPVLVIGQRVVIDQAVVADIQIRPARPRLRGPLPDETALELPFRLWLSPNLHARFTHASQPVRSPTSGRTELWHTRLATLVAAGRGSIVDEHAHPLRTVRAIWARDRTFENPDHAKAPHPAHTTTDPFRTSLDVSDRWDIVHESANFNIPIPTVGAARFYEPVPIAVSRLMLTSLGAWLDSRGQWAPPTKSFEVEEWRHRATMARDHYVRVVYKGYLFPFGHRASLVKVTERKFENLPGRPAFLRQRMFILVRQPLLTFGEPQLTNPSGHFLDLQMPLVSARITTQATPDLDDPAASDFTAPAVPTLQSLFWPKVGGEYFRFQIVAEDSDANRLEFSAPLAFVSNIHSLDTALLGTLRADYENATDASAARRTVDLRGQRMAFAESTDRGDTTFEVDQLVLGAEIPAVPLNRDRASFYPRVKGATIVIPTIKLLTGGSGQTAVTYPDRYLKGGFPLNPGEVFLETDPVPLDFSKGGDRSGGLAQPSMSVTGLSRIMGPIGGSPDKLAGGTFTPAQFFEGMNAKLFGVIDLGDLIGAVGLAHLDLVPKFVTEALGAAESFLKQIEVALVQLKKLRIAAQPPGSNLGAPIDLLVDALGQVVTAVETMVAGNLAPGPLSSALVEVRLKVGDLRKGVDGLPPAVPGEVKKASLATIDRLTRDIADLGFVTRMAEALQVPDELKVSFEWKPKIRCWPKPDDEANSIFINHNKAKQPATFSISAVAEAKTKLRPSPSFDIACRLHNFSLNLFPSASFLRLHFNKIEFTAGSATKPDVTCDFDDVEFVGVLSFVEVLRDFIPLDGFSDPPALDVSEKGIVASYSMGLPNIAFGVFSLEQLSLGAGFTIPFLLDPLSVRFNFCERQRPFLLTVSAIGGGGFFGITLDPDGIQMLEASFECGASLAINLGVASGSVHIMVGIYFKMQGDEAVLEGYFRIGGEMDILGLISASIELYLSLTYEFSSGKCVGRATLTVEIEIFLISMSVEVSCERKFAGSNGDPTFKELMVAEGDWDPWVEYCEAFA